MIRRLRWLAPMLLLLLLLAAVFPQSAFAAPPQHEAPAGSEWVMADWMFLSFLVFAGVAFLAFILALKAGLLANLESAKYYILDIDEEDYYTPDWARDGGDA